jgi:hypothetical protein
MLHNGAARIRARADVTPRQSGRFIGEHHMATIGDRVAHDAYGDGTVTRVNEYHTVIDFDAHGVRTFSSPRVVLSPTTTVAPVKTPARRKRTVKTAPQG